MSYEENHIPNYRKQIDFDSDELPEGAAWEVGGRYHINLYIEKMGERRKGEEDKLISDFKIISADPIKEELPAHLEKIIHSFR